MATWFTPKVAYLLFVALTPLLMLLLFLRQFAKAGQPWKLPPQKWPWWRMIAATVAFAVWALAVPGNFLIGGNNALAGVVVGFLALVVSTVLTMFAPFCERT